MAKTIKLSDEFVAIASEEACVMRRSTGAQVEYWARLGRRLEASGAISPAALRKLLGRGDTVLDRGEESEGADLGALRRKLEALDGSDTRILDDLRAGGHPIASEDEHGRVVVDRAASNEIAAR